jgi:MFS transporter, Spinster family, sphingosine-1-phosphate transporter
MKASRNYKWLLLLMLSGAFFFHQADRAIFGLLTIPIQDELHLTNEQIGWINTVLSWTLAGMAFVAGPVADRFSRKWLITLSLMAWSLMTFMMGFVGDWTVFGFVIPAFFVVMFFRSIATGVGESFYGPCYPPLIAAFHRETRSLALSIHQGALYFGLMTSGVVTAWALGLLGTWRHVFMAFGAAGFALGVFFVFALKEGCESCRQSRRDCPSFFAGMVYFFKTPSAGLAMTGFVAVVFVNNAYLFWAPKFMAEKFGTSVAAAGTQTMLYHHLCAFAAILAGGVLTDHFVKKMPRFRLAFQIVAMLCGAPCILLIGLAPSAAAMIAATAAYGVFRGFFEVNTHASLFDVVPPAYRSTAVGLFTVFAFFFGGLSGVVMGKLSQAHGVAGFETGFALMAAAYVLGAALMAISFFVTFRRDRIAE